MSNELLDLDHVTKLVHDWDQLITKEQHKSDVLKQQVKSFEYKLLLIENCRNDWEKQKEEYLSIISKLKDVVDNRLDQMGEVTNLRLKISELERKMELERKNFQFEIENDKKVCKKLKVQYEESLQDQKQADSLSSMKIKEEAKLELEKLKSELSQLQKTLTNQTQSHEAEIIKIRCQYDDRVAALNNRIQTISNYNKNCAGNQTFQKKLQHQKERHLQEVSALKIEVENLKKLLGENKKESLTSSILKRRKM